MMARRVLLSPLLVFAAVIGQLTVVNRAPLPGTAVPSLVLLVVTALGVTAGPVTGMLAGFGGGLALDVAPPSGHLAGEYALVYCLAGYACGRIREAAQGASAQRHALTSLTVMALGVAAGEAGTAGLGLMLSDPNVTGPAIRHLLPATIVYDLLLCPFALWLVSVAVGRPAYERAPQPHTQAIPVAAAFRQASAGAAPRLRLAGSTAPLTPPPLRQEPRLRLASGRSSSSVRTSAAFSPAHPALGGARPAKVNFTAGRGNQLGGASALRQAAPAGWPRPATSPGKGWLRGSALVPAPARTRKSPGKGWLRAGTQVTPVSWTGRSPGRGWLRGSALVPAPAWAGSSPGKGWLRVGTPMAPVAWQGRSPGRGWLRTGTPVAALSGQGTSLGRGWLRPGKAAATSVRRPATPGKGWARPPKPAPAPHRKSPGKGWLRPPKPPSAPRRKSPGRGWLRPGQAAATSVRRPATPGKGWARAPKPAPAPRRKSPGRGWLRPDKPAPAPRRRSPGKGWLRKDKPARGNWYTGSPSTRWLRRSRRRRLLGGRR